MRHRAAGRPARAAGNTFALVRLIQARSTSEARLSRWCFKRVSRRSDRPLLQVADPKAKLQELMAQRYPVYGLADITVDSVDAPPEVTVERVYDALVGFLRKPPMAVRPGEHPTP